MLRSIDRRTWAIWLVGLLVFGVAGCVGPTASPSITPGPSPGAAPFTAAELRLILIDELGPLWYCDRDEYPVGRDELEGMRENWPQLIADTEMAAAIQQRLSLPPLADASLTDEQRLQAYRLWKMASAVQLEDVGNGQFRFDYLAEPVEGAAEGRRSAGIVNTSGQISVEQAAPAGEPMCPICLAIGTLIDTPDGAISVERLRIGDRIWTLDADGRRVAGSVIALGSTAAPAGHHVAELTLADGRTVTASPGHPLADGRALADLAIGDTVDGSTVVGLELRPYGGAETYDLVASGPTGFYLSGGIPLGSTLD